MKNLGEDFRDDILGGDTIGAMARVSLPLRSLFRRDTLIFSLCSSSKVLEIGTPT
jgi:hypothetical protein